MRRARGTEARLRGRGPAGAAGHPGAQREATRTGASRGLPAAGQLRARVLQRARRPLQQRPCRAAVRPAAPAPAAPSAVRGPNGEGRDSTKVELASKVRAAGGKASASHLEEEANEV
ncbi:unnamed protein product, partial [Prorocentrum cordatum]